MRAAATMMAVLLATPAFAQSQEQVNAIVSQCIFNLTEAEQIIFATRKTESGAIAIKFDGRMGLTGMEKDAVRDCVANMLN